MTRTFGELRYGTAHRRGDTADVSAWLIRAEPHVVMRAKRIFPRAQQIRSGDLVMSDLPENCAELAWMMLRWPLTMTDAAREHFDAQVAAFNQTQQTMELIRTGELRLTGDDWLEPVGVEPYWWQWRYADHVLATGGGNAVHGVGLGKTLACSLVLRAPHARPGLVFTLGGRMPKQWQESLNRHFPMLNVVLGPAGTPSGRRQRAMDAADVIVLPYSRADAYSLRLKGWARTVIFDEAQELRHAGTAKYTGAATLADDADFVAGATATPVYGYAGEIWDVTDAIKKGALGTRYEFISEWKGTNVGMGANVSIANAGPLGAHLTELGLMDVKSREDVGLPPEELTVLPYEIDVTAELDVIHDAASDLETLAKRVIARDGSAQERLAWDREIDHKMRRATGLAKAPGVIDLVQMLAAASEKVLLFAWHRDVYDVYLRGLANLYPVMFTGSESPNQKDRALWHFEHGGAQVMLMSLRAGAGIDGLQRFCATAVLGEMDWSPGIHTQNFGRLSRPGQPRSVMGYLTHCDFGADPVILEVLGVKAREEKGLRGVKMATEPTLSAGDRVRKMAEQILAARA